MAEIKKIHILSLLKIVLVLSLILGLVWGTVMSMYMAKLASADNAQLQAIAQQTGMSVDEITATYKSAANRMWFTFTLVSVISSLLASLIAVLIYNLTAKWWGGIKIDLEK